MLGTVLNWWAWFETVSVVILGTPVVAIIWLFTAPFDKGRYAAGRAFRIVGVTAMRLNGLWKFRTRGSLDDARRPYVVVANHESYADVFLISCFPWEMKWLSKDTMFKIPCMGWMMQMAGDIKLVRGDRDSTINAIAQCRDRLAKKVSVMIFPEGTRSKTQEMLPFKDGAFRLAIETQAPVLPIAVAGTRNAMAKGTFRFLRARALAQVLEPIDTTGMTMDDIGRLKQMARERIDIGRRALAAELGIAMPPLATETVSAA
ncbi:lysophospholipid acyltransferase family protein [Gemmatimonas sp.]|jgi:1-acyl-sn-glycerol-3-phosphate acyltransferase|uniref:lysophospholipid acyltransferase family protein n=1 Tax=Gemmatimonas sp. TaxID=1962908 RepID=UPI0037BEB89F